MSETSRRRGHPVVEVLPPGLCTSYFLAVNTRHHHHSLQMATPVYPLPKRGSNASSCRKPSQLLLPPPVDVLVPPLAPTVLCAEPSPLEALMARVPTHQPSGHRLGHLWEPAQLRMSGLCDLCTQTCCLCPQRTHCILMLLTGCLPVQMLRRWAWAPLRP